MAAKRNAAKCAARGGLTKDEVKDAVAERDGYRCTKCGETDDEHIERTGRRLQVHRKVPGSFYTVEGCVLLCKECHGPEPRRTKGIPDQDGPQGSMLRLPENHRKALEELRKKHRRTLTQEVQIALEKHYKEEGVTLPPPE